MVSDMRARQLTAGRERPVNGGDFATASARKAASQSSNSQKMPDRV